MNGSCKGKSYEKNYKAKNLQYAKHFIVAGVGGLISKYCINVILYILLGKVNLSFNLFYI